jgi:hypothetical protein
VWLANQTGNEEAFIATLRSAGLSGITIASNQCGTRRRDTATALGVLLDKKMLL